MLKFYQIQLSKSMRKSGEESYELFKRVVGSIVILFNPLSAVALGFLLDKSAIGTKQAQMDVEEMLSHLHSVLEVPKSSANPIRLLHPSFRDFLLAEGMPKPATLGKRKGDASNVIGWLYTAHVFLA